MYRVKEFRVMEFNLSYYIGETPLFFFLLPIPIMIT